MKKGITFINFFHIDCEGRFLNTINQINAKYRNKLQ